MENWDQEELERAIQEKESKGNNNRPTDIICKHFLEVGPLLPRLCPALHAPHPQSLRRRAPSLRARSCVRARAAAGLSARAEATSAPAKRRRTCPHARKLLTKTRLDFAPDPRFRRRSRRSSTGGSGPAPPAATTASTATPCRRGTCLSPRSRLSSPRRLRRARPWRRRSRRPAPPSRGPRR